MPEHYTVKEAAEYLGLSDATVRYHIYQSKRLKGELVSPRKRVFTRAELDAFKDAVPEPKGGKPYSVNPK